MTKRLRDLVHGDDEPDRKPTLEPDEEPAEPWARLTELDRRERRRNESEEVWPGWH